MVFKFGSANGTGALSVNSSHEFPTTVSRDSYFTANPTEKVDGVNIYIADDGSGNAVLQEWDEDTTSWVDRTPIIKGDKGDTGDDGSDGVSAYVHVAYADNVDGGTVTNFSSTPLSTSEYISIISTTTATYPDEADFLGSWVEVKGEKGETGETGDTGPQGDPGTDENHRGYYSDLSALNTATGSMDPAPSLGNFAIVGTRVYTWDGDSWEDSGATAQVSSFNGRTGAIVPISSDYDASQIDNDSSVSGSKVSDALDTLAAADVTNGDSHNHDGGDGGQISYTSLSNKPTLGDASQKGVTEGTSNNDTVTTKGYVDEEIASHTSGFGTGDVTGPGTSVDDSVVLFNGTTGKVIKDSSKSIEASLTDDSDAKLPTSKAVADYVGNSKKFTFLMMIPGSISEDSTTLYEDKNGIKFRFMSDSYSVTVKGVSAYWGVADTALSGNQPTIQVVVDPADGGSNFNLLSSALQMNNDNSVKSGSVNGTPTLEDGDVLEISITTTGANKDGSTIIVAVDCEY